MFKIAWRNIWRNKRRTLLTVGAILFSVFLLSSMGSMQEGTYANMLENATKVWDGKLRIFAKGYFQRESLSKSFYVTEELKKLLNLFKINWAERVDGFALVSYKDKTYGASVTGINIQREKNTTFIHSKIIKGRFLESGEKGIAVIGDKLADNLKVKIGDEIAVIAQGKDGSIGAKLFKIIGIFRSQILELDRSKILINIEDADELFSMYGSVTTVVIYFPKEKEKLEYIKYNLEKNLNNTNLEVIDWKEILPELLELIEFDRVSGYMMYAILIIIIAFGLLNTIYMTVFERRKEIAVLRAIGMRRLKIVLMIIFESIYISVIGAVAGFIISFPVIYHFKSNPIKISGKLAEMYESFMFIPEIHFIFSIKLILYISAIIIFISVTMAIFPSLRAVRENLADQLKFEK
ncbi:FtsX-like permease family protein [Candidatus Aminicenantes bacterium AC-708-M15]|jgi:ABC-type lipoprotein release transport system permease subunit|nr:FtsX-like permease family protein [SCandidatus Aminicenantes bacterium Aminicenantia_JdfR_composite]MCP2596645.1 FtsX-like permease family protein [Candidatus Aminicenantes bacterium AC-335-G13]MCP2598216.1 FtsX-like permease family protein [Candidatus Aminicenantes bacterium AC-335-L06]MCP2603951.1 FtsX-like permease family protein [Candidatus Aminicenantes bacterium AC-708-M15]MCP2605593.1 FtsX-like permease family protein [Candidatus Aminicenantes bacterium AC-335-O07]MCP2618547.1 FtsX-l